MRIEKKKKKKKKKKEHTKYSPHHDIEIDYFMLIAPSTLSRFPPPVSPSACCLVVHTRTRDKIQNKTKSSSFPKDL